MEDKYCQIVLVGHTPEKLIFSIDKCIVSKLIFITEKQKLTGSEEAKKTLDYLNKYYKERRVEVENTKFNFHIQTKPIAELSHKILQQKFLDFQNITINISGGLRYIDIWFYIACSITNTKIIHGNFLYEGPLEVGIINNMTLPRLVTDRITDKQFEFLKIFFGVFRDIEEFFRADKSFDENQLLSSTIQYNSIKEIYELYKEKKDTSNISNNSKITRGIVNGYIQKLNEKSLLEIKTRPDEKRKKIVKISYIGIAYFLNELYKRRIKLK